MKNNCVAWNAFLGDGSIATYILYRACKQKNSCDGRIYNEDECPGTDNKKD